MAKKPTPKGKEIFGLDKIPDHILNKQLMLERGQRESYILELEDKNKELVKRLSKYEAI